VHPDESHLGSLSLLPRSLPPALPSPAPSPALSPLTSPMSSARMPDVPQPQSASSQFRPASWCGCRRPGSEAGGRRRHTCARAPLAREARPVSSVSSRVRRARRLYATMPAARAATRCCWRRLADRGFVDPSAACPAPVASSSSTAASSSSARRFALRFGSPRPPVPVQPLLEGSTIANVVPPSFDRPVAPASLAGGFAFAWAALVPVFWWAPACLEPLAADDSAKRK